MSDRLLLEVLIIITFLLLEVINQTQRLNHPILNGKTMVRCPTDDNRSYNK
jgi:hypothetical protein